MAECTDLPLVLLAWQDKQLASLGKMPGCSMLDASIATGSRRRNPINALDVHFIAAATLAGA